MSPGLIVSMVGNQVVSDIQGHFYLFGFHSCSLNGYCSCILSGCQLFGNHRSYPQGLYFSFGDGTVFFKHTSGDIYTSCVETGECRSGD